MERLSFTSADALETYCEQVCTTLSARSDEQRRLIETALERLDQLAAQASAVHSDGLAAEIAARREEGLQLLARLGSIGAPAAASTSVDAPLEPPVPAPEFHAAEASPAPFLALENGHSAPAPFSLNDEGDPPQVAAAEVLEETEPSSALEAPAPAEEFAPEIQIASVFETSPAQEFQSEAPKIEALWDQPVDPQPEPEAEAFEAGGSVSTEVEPDAKDSALTDQVGSHEAPSILSTTLEHDAQAFTPIAEKAPVLEAEPVSAFENAATQEPEIMFGASDQAEEAPVPATIETKAPTANAPSPMNWSWGTETESPAWAELLAGDAPVPMERLSDSHFVHAPPPGEISAASPVPDSTAPPSENANGTQRLVLNVKTGEWGSEHPLSKPELLVGRRDIGSRSMPDVEVMYDQAVSRRHLRISRDNGHYVVEDLDSTNGTTLNGHSLKPGHPEVIKAGDELEIGEFTLLKIAAA